MTPLITEGMRVVLSAMTTSFDRGIRGSLTLLSKFKGAVVSVTRAVSSFVFSLKGLLFSGAIGLAIKNTTDWIDNLVKTADALDLATDKLAGFRLAATETGSSEGALDKGLVKLLQSVDDANRGLTTAQDLFKVLRLDTKELARLAPDEIFFRVADAVKELDSTQQQLVVTTGLMGRRNATLVNTLRLGREGLMETVDAAKALGLAIDRDTARGVERAIDAFGRFKSAVRGIFVSLVAELAPFMELISNSMTDFLIQNQRGQRIGRSIANFIISAVGKIGDLIQRMVAFVIDAVADIRYSFLNFRQTRVGRHLGLSVTNEEGAAQIKSIADLKLSARGLRENTFSAYLKGVAAAARAKSASVSEGNDNQRIFNANKAAMQEMLSNPGALFKSFKEFVRPSSQGSLGTQAAGFASSSGMLGGLVNSLVHGIAQNVSNFGKQNPLLTRSLNLQRADSVEGFQQRMRSLTQGGRDITKQQLEVQQKQKSILEKIEQNTRGGGVEIQGTD